MIRPPHLDTPLLFDVSRCRILHLNRRMASSSLEDLGAPRETAPFYLELIVLEMEGGLYMGPIFPEVLMQLVSGRRTTHRLPGGVSGGRNGGGSRGRSGSGRNGGGVRSGMAQGTEVQEVAQGFRCDMMRT